jgi:hypothetical protein
MTASAWICTCGQRYRVEVLPDDIRFWPRISSDRVSVDGYCRRGLPERARCIRCESPLVLSNSYDADAPLTRDVRSLV